MPTEPSAQQLIEELRHIQECRSAVTDLTAPCKDLHHVDRNDFTSLLSLLDRHSNRVLGDFERILNTE